MISKLAVIAFTLVASLLMVNAQARQVSSTDFLIDCSGCSLDQKRGMAIVQPWDGLLGDLPRRHFNVDVTDFTGRSIIRFEVTLARLYKTGGILRRIDSAAVPSAKQLEFAKALEVVDTITFLGPDDDFGGVEPIPTTYPSAFDLIGDNGSQELVFSDLLNNTQWPDSASELFGGESIKDALESATQMLLDFLGQDIKVVTEAFDGTIIIVEADLIQGQDGEIRVLWKVADDGLRLADGNIISDSTGQPGSGFSGRGRASADQLYNRLSGRGGEIYLEFDNPDSGECTWTFSCNDSECTLSMQGRC